MSKGIIIIYHVSDKKLAEGLKEFLQSNIKDASTNLDLSENIDTSRSLSHDSDFVILFTKQSVEAKSRPDSELGKLIGFAVEQQKKIIPVYYDLRKEEYDSVEWNKGYKDIEKWLPVEVVSSNPKYLKIGYEDICAAITATRNERIDSEKFKVIQGHDLQSADAYIERGQNKLDNNQLKDAREDFNQAIRLNPDSRKAHEAQIELGKRGLELLARGSQGKAETETKQERREYYELLCRHYTTLIEILENVSDPKATSLRLARGVAYQNLEQYDDALRDFNFIVEKVQDQKLQAEALLSIGEIYRESLSHQNLVTSFQNFKKALDLVNTLDSAKAEKLRTQTNEVRRILEGRPSRLTSIDVTKRIQTVLAEFSNLNDLISNAVNAETLGDFLTADKAFEEAISHLNHKVYPYLDLLTAHTLIDSAMFKGITQQKKKAKVAERHLNDAEKKLSVNSKKISKDEYEEMSAILQLNHSSTAHVLKNDIEQAKQHLRKAKEHANQLSEENSRKSDILITVNINYAHYCADEAEGLKEKPDDRKAKLQEAQGYAIDALELAKKAGNQTRELDAGMKLGEIYNRLGDYRSAKKQFGESKQLAEKLGHAAFAFDARIGIAEVLRKSNDLQDAEETLLEIEREASDSFSKAYALIELGNLYRENKKDYLRAKEYYVKAEEVAEDPDMVADIKLFIAECENEQDKDKMVATPPPSTKRDKVFISYSHRDQIWLDDLMISLKPLIREKTINVWSDKTIKPGDTWRTEIDDALTSAKVAVLLVSRNFLASDFIMEEEVPVLLAAAEKKQLRVIWVALTASSVRQSKIYKYQAAHNPDEPLESLQLPDKNKRLETIAEYIQKAFNE